MRRPSPAAFILFSGFERVAFAVKVVAASRLSTLTPAADSFWPLKGKQSELLGRLFRLENRIQKVGNELLPSSRKRAHLLDLTLQLWRRSSLAVGRLFADERFD